MTIRDLIDFLEGEHDDSEIIIVCGDGLWTDDISIEANMSGMFEQHSNKVRLICDKG